MDFSLPGSSVHGILQARILEWVAISFSRESSQPGDWTWVSCSAGRFFTILATCEAHILNKCVNHSQWGSPFIHFLCFQGRNSRLSGARVRRSWTRPTPTTTSSQRRRRRGLWGPELEVDHALLINRISLLAEKGVFYLSLAFSWWWGAPTVEKASNCWILCVSGWPVYF